MSRRYFTPIRFEVPNFAGGLNYRDDGDAIEPNELSAVRNFIVNARGGLESRLGTTTGNTGDATGPVIMSSMWPSVSRVVFQVGGKLYVTAVTATPTMAFGTLVHTFTTSERIAVCEFNGQLVGVHPTDGVFTVDAALTFTIVNATIKCIAIAAWQNYVWATGDKNFPSRTWRSNLANAAVWTTASDFADFREKDDTPCTAIGGGSGMDISGRPTLLVAKRDSAYRINNPTTMAYTMLSRNVGCVNPYALATSGSFIGMLHTSGFYLTDGVSEPQKVSGKVDPAFDPENPAFTDFSTIDKWSACRHGKRFLFATGGSPVRTLWEFDPVEKWVMRHDTLHGIGTLMTFTPTGIPGLGYDAVMCGGPIVANHYFVLFRNTVGTDCDDFGNSSGMSIAAASKWFRPNGLGKVNLRHLRALCRSGVADALTLQALKNFDESGAVRSLNVLTAPNGQFEYGHADLWGIGKGQSFKFRWFGTQTTIYTSAGDVLLGATQPRVTGEFAVYGLEATAYSLGDA